MHGLLVRCLRRCYLRERAVMVKGRLREVGRARGVVDSSILILRERDHGVRRGTERCKLPVALCPGRAVVSHIEEKASLLDLGHGGLNPAYELGTEDEDRRIRLFEAVLDLV